MALTVEIKVNGTLIAGATAHNISALAQTSDYAVEVVETAAPWLGRPANFHTDFQIKDHHREQTSFALIRKIVDEAIARMPGEVRL